MSDGSENDPSEDLTSEADRSPDKQPRPQRGGSPAAAESELRSDSENFGSRNGHSRSGAPALHLSEEWADRLRDVVRGPSADLVRRMRQSMGLDRIWQTVWSNQPQMNPPRWGKVTPKLPVVLDDAWTRRLMGAPIEAFLERIRVDMPALDFSRLVRPEIWTGLDRLVESLKRLIPANLRDLEIDEWAHLVEISEEQRMGVAWVPRTQVLRLLLDAGSVDERAQVLRDHAEAILDDCVASLSETNHSALVELVDFAVEAIETHRAGRTRAAQALATNVLDTALEQYHEDGVKGFRAACKRLPGLDEDRASLLEVRLRMVTAGIPSAYNGYDYDKRNPRFSRTGTAHAVNAALYTPDNSLRAITLATVWLRWLHETWTDEDRHLSAGTGSGGARTPHDENGEA